jgi:hypothetical protein
MVSIIIGLGASNLLTNLGRLIQARKRVRFYWITLIWMGLLFFLHVHTWWAIWRWKDYESWNLGVFLYVLLLSVLLYLLAFTVVPYFSTRIPMT